MKIAVSANGKSIESSVAEAFGRCPYFIFVQIKDDKIVKTEAMKNKNTDQSGGAGISTARLMAENEVNAVVAGNIGPRALDVLRQFNIEAYSGAGTVKQALRDYMDKKLKMI